MPNLIDYGFLSAREGALVLDGYVPAPTVSRSGVTIATGVDLGQRSKAEYAHWDCRSRWWTSSRPTWA